MSIVLKLQKKCLDQNENLQSLLREALLISTKLKLNDFKEWINFELKGYISKEVTPEYRKINQTLKFFNPYDGWIDAQLSEELFDIIGKIEILQPIAELEHLLTENGELSMSIAPNHIQFLQKTFNTDCKPGFFIVKTALFGITEQVRNLLLEWTLKLEEDGILGNEDLIFTEEEKESAKSIHVENFHGVIGDIDKLGIMSTGANSTNTYYENNLSNEFDKLIHEIKKLKLQDEEQVIIDLEACKHDNEKAKTILGGLLSRGAEVASIGSMIISILGLL